MNTFNHQWTYQVRCISPALVYLVVSKFLAEHVTGEFIIFIHITPCWMETPWPHTVLKMLEVIPLCVPIVRDLFRDASLHLTLTA